ncbi:MAG: serine/threonine-protein kinase [Myxococcota bacterium]
MERIGVGPFEVFGLAGRGGMGSVWRAHHGPSSTQVAVKTVRPGREGRDGRFQSEIRSMARLRHPHIARILDYGELDAAASQSLEAPDGAPWLAMEWLESPLDGLPPARVLRCLLQALAHAHAHGIVHRDIKPSNVRVSADGRPCLVDFGLASTRDDGPDVAGTLSYMAPEQLSGGVAGPSADLYSVGCVAWKLLTGEPPIRLVDRAQATWAHASWSMPADLPWSGPLRDWLAGLLQRAPGDRFRSAAEALAALDPIPDSDFVPAIPSLPDDPSTFLGTKGPLPAPSAPTPLAPARRVRLPLGPVPRARLGLGSGTGPGLFGLREPEPVGREALIEALWRDAARAEPPDGPVVSALIGGPGVGKTLLARWIGRQLAERGALVIELRHQQGEPALHALRRALTEGAYDRSPLVLPPVLAGLVEGEPSNEHETWGAFAALLARHATDRRVALLVDEPEWGEPSLARRLHGPVWMACATTDPAWTPADAHRYEVGPLAPDAHRALVTELLDLEPTLAERVAERCEGHPLYAVHLLADWVRSGELARSERGLAGDGLAERSLPDGLAALLRRRFEHLPGPTRRPQRSAGTWTGRSGAQRASSAAARWVPPRWTGSPAMACSRAPARAGRSSTGCSGRPCWRA